MARIHWRWTRRVFALTPLLLVPVVVAVRLATSALAAPAERAIAIETLAAGEPPAVAEHLRLITINLAHGRAEGASQLTTPDHRIRANLEAIGRLLAGRRPDLVCVQEADSPSWWSGDIDHLALVAAAADLPLIARGSHVEGAGLRYGTGILARWPLADARARTFAPSPPTFAKGFTLAAVDWPGRELRFDLVSVHLDFASAVVRRSQIEDLIAVVRARGRPVIVAGDLNRGWDEGGVTRHLSETLALRTWAPEAELATFPATGHRLDWILVSAPFHIAEHRLLPDPVSDHRALEAVIVIGDAEASHRDGALQGQLIRP